MPVTCASVSGAETNAVVSDADMLSETCSPVVSAGAVSVTADVSSGVVTSLMPVLAGSVVAVVTNDVTVVSAGLAVSPHVPMLYCSCLNLMMSKTSRHLSLFVSSEAL